MVGKLFQGESVHLQVMMLPHSHKASHHILSPGAVMSEEEKNILNPLGLIQFTVTT